VLYITVLVNSKLRSVSTNSCSSTHPQSPLVVLHGVQSFTPTHALLQQATEKYKPSMTFKKVHRKDHQQRAERLEARFSPTWTGDPTVQTATVLPNSPVPAREYSALKVWLSWWRVLTYVFSGVVEACRYSSRACHRRASPRQAHYHSCCRGAEYDGSRCRFSCSRDQQLASPERHRSPVPFLV